MNEGLQMWTTHFQNGLILGLSLIMAIGAQNIFVIRQAISKQSPILTASLCGLCDTFMILAGSTSIGLIVQNNKILQNILLFGGVLFLCLYGFKSAKQALSLRQAQKGLDDLEARSGTSKGKRATILATLSFSILNPHAVIDTMILIGGAVQQVGQKAQAPFLSGTIAASFAWFFTLTILGLYASHILRKARFWQFFQLTSATIMFYFAYKLGGTLLETV